MIKERTWQLLPSYIKGFCLSVPLCNEVCEALCRTEALKSCDLGIKSEPPAKSTVIQHYYFRLSQDSGKYNLICYSCFTVSSIPSFS